MLPRRSAAARWQLRRSTPRRRDRRRARAGPHPGGDAAIRCRARSLVLLRRRPARRHEARATRCPSAPRVRPTAASASALWAPGADARRARAARPRRRARMRADAVQRAADGWHDAHVGARRRRRSLRVPRRRRPRACPIRPRAAIPTTCTGRARVVDPRAYRWRDDAWRGRPWHEAVIYELHVGTFTPEGTFAAAIEHARPPRRARRHRGRADAGRRFPGPAQLGLRRRAAVRARRRVRHARRPEARSSTQRTRAA